MWQTKIALRALPNLCSVLYLMCYSSYIGKRSVYVVLSCFSRLRVSKHPLVDCSTILQYPSSCAHANIVSSFKKLILNNVLHKNTHKLGGPVEKHDL